MSNLPAHQPMQNPGPATWAPPVVIDESEKNKFDFWGLLNRRKWLIFLGILTGCGIGLVYHFNTPPTYESKASILIEPKNPYMSPLSRTDMGPIPGAATFMTTRHDKIIASKDFVGTVLRKRFGDNESSTRLLDRPSFANLTEEEAINSVLSDLEIEPDRDEPNVFNLRLKAKDPNDSREIINSICREYQRKIEDRYQKTTSAITSEFKNATDRMQEYLDEELMRRKELLSRK